MEKVKCKKVNVFFSTVESKTSAGHNGCTSLDAFYLGVIQECGPLSVKFCSL